MKEKLKQFYEASISYIKEAKMELIVLISLLALDLISKAIVAGAMELGESVTLIPKFLHITYSQNDAAAFGSAFGIDKLIGQKGALIFFMVLSIVAVCFFSYFLYKNKSGHKLIRVAYALIIAGAMGNLVDRVCYGYVRDFIEFEYLGLEIFGSTSFAIFNFADAALCIGVTIFAVFYIFIYKEPKKETKETESETEAVVLDEAETAQEQPSVKEKDNADY